MEKTAKASVMKWFKKLSLKSDAKSSKVSSNNMFVRWFKKSTDETLKLELDVVPRTEITSSRQALNNISYSLNGAESSGESSGISHRKGSRSHCTNKHCCDNDVESQQADNGDDESIKKNSKSPLIDKLRAADKAQSIDDNEPETKCRRPLGNVKNRDYIIFFEASVDYGRLECPDSFYPSVIETPTVVRQGRYVQLKNKQQRNYSDNYDLFTTTDKLEPNENNKSELNYKILSDVERQLDTARYNLLNCRLYNAEYRSISNFADDWPLEDFNDDAKSTRMSEDTGTIKEFYRLSNESDVLIHFQDVCVETGFNYEQYSTSVLNFLTWCTLKGDEITEENKVEKSSWLKAIVTFFKKITNKKSKSKGSEA